MDRRGVRYSSVVSLTHPTNMAHFISVSSNKKKWEAADVMKLEWQLEIGEDSARQVEGWKLLDGRVGENLYLFFFWLDCSIPRLFLSACANVANIQGEHKGFPSLQTFITRKLLYVEYKHIYIFLMYLKKFFYNTSVHFNMCSFCCTEKVWSIINFSPRVLQHVFSYCSKSVSYSCLQICNIWNWCRKHFVLNIPP